MASAPAGHLTINQAAARLNVSPWEVLDLINNDRLKTVTFVDAASLATYEKESA